MAPPCTFTCILSGVVVLSMIFMTNMMTIPTKYEQQLPETLKKSYKDIVKERTQIYYTGYGLGLFLALALIFYNTQVKKEKMGWPSMVCLTVSVAFLTNYFYYILTPKTKWMLDEITTPEQTKAWLDMYRAMQVYYHGSFALGILAIGLITFAFRC
jgi:hypothetical protein